jgi:hypothetical protein
MLTFKQFKMLQEALRNDQKADVNAWRKGNNEFSDKLFGGPDTDKETHQRRYFDFDSTAHADSPAKEAIEGHLSKHGYKVHDYKAGLAKDKHGRDVRIGKALGQTKAEPNLVKKFAEDPVRAQKNKQNLRVLISRHPHDVAGMTSCGHSWENSSCMNFESGKNRHNLQQDLKHGTHVAYLVHADDQGHPQKPLARIAIKKHSDENQNSILVPEPSIYGDAPKGFEDQVKHILDTHHNHHQPMGAYHKNENIYDDGSGRTVAHVRSHEIGAALGHHSIDVRVAAISHPNATHEHITKALADGNPLVRVNAIRHPNATHEHITKALADAQPPVRDAAISHPNATYEHITKALADGSAPIRGSAVSHPNATHEHITKALADEDYYVRAKAVSHPNATHEHITKALADEDDYVRAKAVSHPNATHEHITKALADKKTYVRKAALSAMTKRQVNPE